MIVATAGHVDHGKTSLVKQLTGVNTDRLEEEQRRGLSISLGFAYRNTGTGESIGFIDVPGHRRFINTMISGVSGVDLGMLVVDAGDGVMPQTLEHIDVMRLLGVRDYIIVITKIDRTDSARIRVVRDALMELLPQRQVFEVSNISGAGIAALQAFLDEQAAACQAHAASGHFRLSIDRAFVLKGTGLVVTGTVASGRVEVGDTLQLLAANQAGQAIKVRVRSIHAQDQPAPIGSAGQRCALNIVGDIDRQDIQRGDVLADPRCANPGQRFDARLELLAEAPFALSHLQPVKLYIGARRVSAKVFFLDHQQLAEQHNEALPAGHRLAQFILKDELLVCWGDRFLIQDDSESVILGGGVVLNPRAPKWRKSQAQHLQYLTAMMLGNPLAILQQLILKDQQVIDYLSFRQALNLLAEEGEAIIQDASLTGKIIRIASAGTELLWSTTQWQELRERICKTVQGWQAVNPTEQGIKFAELQQRLGGGTRNSLMAATMAALIQEHRLVSRDGLVSLPGHSPTRSPQGQRNWMLLQNMLAKGGFRIPLLSEIERESGLSPKDLSAIIRTAIKAGNLLQVSKRRVALPGILRKLAVEVNALAVRQVSFSVIDAKKQLGLGRDLTIEILQYFDAIRFTQRKGEGRIVLDPTLPEKLFNS